MKMDMNAVADKHRARNERIINASAPAMAGTADYQDAYCEALALALLELAEMWREDARKAMEENKRGCKGTAESLRDCATRVSAFAIAIRTHGLPIETPEQSAAIVDANLLSMGVTLGGIAHVADDPANLRENITPTSPEAFVEGRIVGYASAQLDPAAASPKVDVAVEQPSPAGSGLSTPPDAPLSAASDLAEPVFTLKSPDLVQAFLDDVGNGQAGALYAKLSSPVNDPNDEETLAGAASAIIAQVTEQRAADAIDPGQIKIIKAATILTGHGSPVDLPSLVGPEGIRKAAEAAGMTYPNLPEETIDVQWQVGGADPAPAWALQPQVPVMELTDDPQTWQDLPAHASVSQLQLMAECGLKYWLRYRRGAPERPSWAMVGGSALHSCIEEIEREIVRGAQDLNGVVKGMWLEHLQAQINKTQTANPLWPVETWHASKSGKEDRAWWDSDGPEMVHRYLAWRAHWIAQGWELIKDAQGPIVEREFLIFLGGKPVKGFIDQAWYHPQRQFVAIIDVKSGASAPPDYFQPATYALALGSMINHLNAYAQTTYVGGYWDARKGELMAPGLVNLEERHPQLEVGFRFAQFNAATSANIYMPNTNSAYGGCNSCSLKRSCPIGSRIGAGTIDGTVKDLTVVPLG